jgi:hypothetical protein
MDKSTFAHRLRLRFAPYGWTNRLAHTTAPPIVFRSLSSGRQTKTRLKALISDYGFVCIFPEPVRDVLLAGAHGQGNRFLCHALQSQKPA